MRAHDRIVRGEVRVERLPPGPHLAGQADDCSVRLRGAGVGGHHLRIDLAPEGTYRVTDLGASGGTRVNGERVVVADNLGEIDVIRVGDDEFTVQVIGRPQNVPSPPSTARGGRGDASARFIEMAHQRHRRLIFLNILCYRVQGKSGAFRSIPRYCRSCACPCVLILRAAVHKTDVERFFK